MKWLAACGAWTLRILALLLLVGAAGAARGADRFPDPTGMPGGSEEGGGYLSARDSLALAGPFFDLAGPVDPTRYLLGPGDVLSLEYSGRVYRQASIAIDAEGRINVPEIGVLSTSGLTLATVRDRILARLRALYTGVHVDLRLVRVRVFKVYVVGQVVAPGPVLANATMRVSEILRAGVAFVDGASRRNIVLRHRDGRAERVDLDRFTLLGLDDRDPYLQDGDVVSVPARKAHVFALGAFSRGGEFELAPGDSVHTLVALAQGLLPATDPASGLLYRFNGPTQIDTLSVALTGGPGAGDPPLMDGDRLFAREIPDFQRGRNVTLTGEFVRPGPYAIREGVDRIGDIVARAGGLTSVAARNRIQVFRPPTTVAGRRDTEFERLLRLTRTEMSDAEYLAFRSKLASQEAVYILTADDLHHEDNSRNVLLRDGDIVAVDRETPSVRVDGQVRLPSLIAFVPGRSVDDYIDLAGGFGAHAWRSKVRITRPGVNQALYVSDAGAPEPGDFIWVPEKNQVSFWGVFKDVLTVAGAAATVVLVVRGH